MTAAHVNGNSRKRRRVEETFTFQHGLSLLINATGTTVTSILAAATRSFEHSAQQPTEHDSADGLQPPRALQPPVHHTDSNGSVNHRRNAAEVDEEDWHDGQQQHSDTTNNTITDNASTSAIDHTNKNNNNSQHPVAAASTTINTQNGIRTRHNSPPHLPPPTPPPAAPDSTIPSTQQTLPPVKIEPVSSNKPLSSTPAQKKSGTAASKKKKEQRVGVLSVGASGSATVDERDVRASSSSLPRKSNGAVHSTPAAKRSLYTHKK